MTDTHEATIAANESRARSWTFNATFDLFAHPALVGARAEDAEKYVCAALNQPVVKEMELFSFAMPQAFSSFIDPQACGARHACDWRSEH